MSARPKPLIDRTLSDGTVIPILEAGLQCLPFTKDQWDRVTKAFFPHNAIGKAIPRKKCYSTSLDAKTPAPDEEDIKLYTAVMTEQYPNNLAISSTYFPKARQALAIIYGCNREQMSRVQQLLLGASEVHEHEMLLPGIFAELERDRLEGLVVQLEAEYLGIYNDLKINENQDMTRSRSLSWQGSRRMVWLLGKAKNVEEEARIIKEQFQAKAKEIRPRQRKKRRAVYKTSSTGMRTGSRNS